MKEFEYVRDYYGVPAEKGRIIYFKGKKGMIVADKGNYIGVTFEGEDPKSIHILHPTWEVKYGEMGEIKEEKLTRSQKRYREYLEAREWYDGTFSDWLGIDMYEVRKRKEKEKWEKLGK